MISVEEALNHIENSATNDAEELQVDLGDGLGHYLAEDILSPIDMPPFSQAAMDGYAIKKTESKVYHVRGELKAGGNSIPDLKPGDAYRIYTGSPVPPSADAVIMQEKVSKAGDKIDVQCEVISGMNIRRKGEQTRVNNRTMTKGNRMTPAAIGFLSMLGITSIKVFKKPRVAVVVTGDELIAPGTDLKYGQIYNSNSFMLKAALQSKGHNSVHQYHVSDDYGQTLEIIETAIKDNDVVILTGGISVGDYDFVGKALDELNVKKIFYKVNQKPGKPMFYGKFENKHVFALPGNPGAALTCFYIYVFPLLELISGSGKNVNMQIKVELNRTYLLKGGRSQFIKATIKDNQLKVLDGQSSAMLHTFSQANALLYLPATKETWEAGEIVDAILI